jgi:DNA-binding NarL/FixJ family response regulator
MILLASPSPYLLQRWKQALDGFRPVMTVDHAGSLRTSLTGGDSSVLVVDLDLPGLDTPKTIARLTLSSPTTSIVALSGPIPEEMELSLFKSGVRGYCRNDIDPQLLKRVVVAVELGELWIRRSLMARLVDELGMRVIVGAKDKHTILARLALLTAREHQIASVLAAGRTNKEIAKQFDISERTVKAHVSEIFRKVGIGDRLKLALLLASVDGA